MNGVRQPILGPVVYGPTGPAYPVALTVPTGGTHLNLDEPRFDSLRYAAEHDIPLAVAADGGAVFYNWAMVGSGLSADPAMTAIGATGVNQCGVVYANTRLDIPELAPHGAKGLVINRLNGGTATIRFWRTG
jgi:hypothetical protein